MDRRAKADLDDQDVENRLIDGIASGFGITELARKQGYPTIDAVYRRMAKNETFAKRIAQARIAQQERVIEQTVEMADKATPENWQVIKLRIWARQWRAAKLAPKKYGDRAQVEHTGEVGLVVKVLRFDQLAPPAEGLTIEGEKGDDD